MNKRVVKEGKVIKVQVEGAFWELIIYPESIRKDFRDILNKKGISWVCSPLHDKDEAGDGELVKPHYHLLICAKSGHATEETILKKISEIFTKEYKLNLQKKDNFENAVLYMTHDEYTMKKKYSFEDLTYSEDNKKRIEKLIKYGSEDDQLDLEFDILDEIRDKGFVNFSHFMFYLKDMAQKHKDKKTYRTRYSYAKKNFAYIKTIIESCFFYQVNLKDIRITPEAERELRNKEEMTGLCGSEILNRLILGKEKEKE